MRGRVAFLMIAVLFGAMMVSTCAVAQDPIELTGSLTLFSEGGYDNLGNLAFSATAFSTPWIVEPARTETWDAVNIVDGIYGGSGANWIGYSASSTLGKGFVGLNFGATAQEIGYIAFSENNLLGEGDRWAGLYEIQYTTVASPDASTADSNWTSLGTVTYNSSGAGIAGFENFQNPSKRHIYSFSSVMATGIRLVVPEVWEENATASTSFPTIGYSETATAIDELEAYAPDKVFGSVAYSADGVTLLSEGGTYTNDNLALATGAVAFGSSEHTSASHTIAHANDGIYGNTNSWLSNLSASMEQYIAIALAEEATIDSIAFGRDNTSTGGYDGNPSTGYTDRCLGEYAIQYTTVADPANTTLTDTDWIDIGSIQYLISPEEEGLTDLAGSEFYSPYKRHEIGFDAVTATAIRIVISDPGICIDEFEVYAAEVPEPSSVVLLLGIMASLAIIRRIKK